MPRSSNEQSDARERRFDDAVAYATELEQKMVAWVSLGAGEHMTDRALIHLHTMLGRYDFNTPF